MQPTQATTESYAGLIIREREPANLEYPFDRLNDFLTPNDLFYIRSHFPVPRLNAEEYELRIDGAVSRPCSFRYEELRKMPSITIPATLECAGNGRVFLSPQVNGAQWQLGAVSTAEWTGVPLSELLDRAQLRSDACEIVFEGADKGTPKERPVPPGKTPYARSIAVEKARDVLIAYEMNGEPLPPDHGFPLRAIVPGHYAMASVKWLVRIRAVTEPFQGYWQTSDYAYWDDLDGNPVRRPLHLMAIKSSIARPRTREVVRAGEIYPVFGAAWSGGSELKQIEVSVDEEEWQPADFLDPPRPFVWRRWQFQWHVPQTKGSCVLKARARDSSGHLQPEAHDRRFGSYVIHHTVGIEVIVR